MIEGECIQMVRAMFHLSISYGYDVPSHYVRRADASTCLPFKSHTHTLSLSLPLCRFTVSVQKTVTFGHFCENDDRSVANFHVGSELKKSWFRQAALDAPTNTINQISTSRYDSHVQTARLTHGRKIYGGSKWGTSDVDSRCFEKKSNDGVDIVKITMSPTSDHCSSAVTRPFGVNVSSKRT
jgi:hypothetical protein